MIKISREDNLNDIDVYGQVMQLGKYLTLTDINSPIKLRKGDIVDIDLTVWKDDFRIRYEVYKDGYLAIQFVYREDMLDWFELDKTFLRKKKIEKLLSN